jgi:hypothetical protein
LANKSKNIYDMNEEDRYKELTRKLRKSNVEFTAKEEVGKKIFSQLSTARSRKKIILNSFYSWTEVKWLRWSISTAAVLFIAIFFSQQVLISTRLSKLEEQLINTETNVQSGEASIPPYHRVILNLISDRKFDSVTVSKTDLEALFQEYMHLQEENEDLKNRTETKSLMNSYVKVQDKSGTTKKL